MREGRECLDLWEVFKSAKSEECRKCLLIDYSKQAQHAFDLQMLIVKLYGKKLWCIRCLLWCYFQNEDNEKPQPDVWEYLSSNIFQPGCWCALHLADMCQLSVLKCRRIRSPYNTKHRQKSCSPTTDIRTSYIKVIRVSLCVWPRKKREGVPFQATVCQAALRQENHVNK